MSVFEIFRDRWKNENLDVNPPVDAESIVRCFEQFGISPQQDLLELYKTLNGKGCMDQEMFELWPLARIEKENSSEKERDRTKRFGVLFADYSFSAWEYRINSSGQVLIDYYDGKEPEIRGDSIKDFFELMLKDPDEVLL